MLIIDGHNLIGLSGQIKISDPQAKEKLLENLSIYQELNNQQIIVVFDGAHFAQAEKTTHKNIQIFYPAKQQNADDIIKNLIQKNNNQHGIIIVSSDNDIINCAQKSHLQTISSKIFYKNMLLEISQRQDNLTEEYLSPHSTDDWIKWYENEKQKKK